MSCIFIDCDNFSWHVSLILLEFYKNQSFYNSVFLTIYLSWYFWLIIIRDFLFCNQMNFDFVSIDDTTKKRILIRRIFNISDKMKNIWEFIKKKLTSTQNTQKRQANRIRTNSSKYKMNDLVWLFIRNIKISKSSKKLNHKMSDFYKVLKVLKKACQLELSQSMKIHDTFYIFLLRSASIDFLIK